MRSNAKVAELLRRYAAALSLEGANRFKLKAYRRAAETLEGLEDDVEERVRQGRDLTELPGIGKAIKDSIVEIVRTGRLGRLERSLGGLSDQQVELATKPGLDPKKVNRVYKKLGIHSLEELRERLDDGTIRDVMGPRTDYHVRQGLDERPRHLLYSVQDLGARIERYLRNMPGVTCVSNSGSLRRKCETVGDLNFLVAAASSSQVLERFDFGGVLSSEPRGDRERTFGLSSGLSVSLRWTPIEQWGWALIHATGSPVHVADLELWAKRQKLHFTPSGLARHGIDVSSEVNIYNGLGLSFIEPELREGRGEVRAAAGKLPKLIQLGDLRGDLHAHTTASDGMHTIVEMAAAAKARGYEYLAITDHSKSLRITDGLSEERLWDQIHAIDKVNAGLKHFRVLKSAEVDILEHGTLDYSDGILKELDFTICSVHSRFGLDREQQTERIMRAMDNRYFTILGHATGRLLLKRPGYDLDIERLLEHAKVSGCYFEINSSPDRLDLSAENAQQAKDLGIKIAINTDAHGVDELDLISNGINQARRAWLQANDVLNALPLETLLRQVRR